MFKSFELSSKNFCCDWCLEVQYAVKVPFEAALLIEAAVGLEGHSLEERVYIKIQQSM